MARFHSLKVRDVRQETPDCVSIALDVPVELKDDFSYIQGQYLTFKAEIEGEEIRRSYSICSGPLEEGELRVAVKKVPMGKFSGYANDVVKVGDTLETMPPMGNFYTELDPANEKHYAAYVAGSGITPVMSIIKTVMEVEPNSRFSLFYGNRTTHSIIFREQLEDLKNRYLGRLSLYHILSREELSSDLFHGRITGEKCAQFCDVLLPANQVDDYFLCGPGDMIMDVKETLETRGVAKEHIHFELFTAPGQKTAQAPVEMPKGPKVESDVKIIMDGDEIMLPLASDGDNILDAALNAGLDVPFACKGAVCCTCKARVLEGEVFMERNYALDDKEVADGYILTCQSHPRTETVVVDFDQY